MLLFKLTGLCLKSHGFVQAAEAFLQIFMALFKLTRFYSNSHAFFKLTRFFADGHGLFKLTRLCSNSHALFKVAGSNYRKILPRGHNGLLPISLRLCSKHMFSNIKFFSKRMSSEQQKGHMFYNRVEHKLVIKMSRPVSEELSVAGAFAFENPGKQNVRALQKYSEIT
jgi:hypothetical protein